MGRFKKEKKKELNRKGKKIEKLIYTTMEPGRLSSMGSQRVRHD